MNTKVCSTEYAVEVNNLNGFVRQLEVFQTYEEAEQFLKDCNEPLNDDEYLTLSLLTMAKTAMKSVSDQLYKECRKMKNVAIEKAEKDKQELEKI